MEEKIAKAIQMVKVASAQHQYSNNHYKEQIAQSFRDLNLLLLEMRRIEEKRSFSIIYPTIEALTPTNMKEPPPLPQDSSDDALADVLDNIDSQNLAPPPHSPSLSPTPPMYQEHIPGQCKCDDCADYHDIINGYAGSETSDRE